MKTIFNQQDRAGLTRRLETLTPDSRPKWGRFDSNQMLAHLADSARMALGDLKTNARGPGPLRFKPIRHAVIYWLPFPKGAPTAPELIERRCEDPSREIADLKSLLERIATRSEARDWPEHPAFGDLTARDWGVLIHRHVDHHLKQFGA